MQDYFQADIVLCILYHLNKRDSFNFLNIAKFMKSNKRILYGKYLFDSDSIQNNDIKIHVKNLICTKIEDAQNYKYLEYLRFLNEDFNGELIVPNTLESLYMKYCWAFNRSLHFVNLKSLSLDFCYNFNQPLNNLPNTLKTIYINCFSFNQPLDNLPKSLESLTIISSEFNQSLDNLPNTLKFLHIKSPVLNQKTDHLYDKIKTVYIE